MSGALQEPVTIDDYWCGTQRLREDLLLCLVDDDHLVCCLPLTVDINW